jgi:hypothetical protein
MSVDSLVADIIRSGILALIGSRVTRSIGEKDISDIISGTGWAIIAVDVIGIAKPTATAIGKFFSTIAQWGTKMEGLLNNSDSLLNKIISFGSKEQILEWLGR